MLKITNICRDIFRTGADLTRSVLFKGVVLLCLLRPASVYGQINHNLQWVLNNYAWLDFRADSLKIGVLPNPSPHLNPGDYSTSICDSSGTLLFYSGGCYVLNTKNQVMKNGDSITSDKTLQNWCDYNDFPLKMNNTIIPYPGSPEKYIIFNCDFENIFGIGGPLAVPVHIFYHIVDMSLDNGLGEVIDKKHVIIEDTLGRGYLTAVRQANGVDWWVICPKWNSNCYFKIPVTSNGIGQNKMECVGVNWGDNDLSGQAAFSPDGAKYARIQNSTGLWVYDFDPLAGELSNPLQLEYVQVSGYGRGLAFSPNSRYLYVTCKLQVFQFDLWATDIQASLQVVADIDPASLQPGQNYLILAKIGPDGKIYIAGTGSHTYLSVINKPNCAGLACDFQPYAIKLPVNNYFGLPNLPEFGIPNSNYDCDMVGANESYEKYASKLLIYPNPTSGIINFNTKTGSIAYWRLYNGTFELIDGGGWRREQGFIDMTKYPNGIYFFQAITDKGNIYTSKVAVQK